MNYDMESLERTAKLLERRLRLGDDEARGALQRAQAILIEVLVIQEVHA